MTRAARLYTDLQPGGSPCAVYGTLAEAMSRAGLVIFKSGVLHELHQELHSWPAVMDWLVGLATRLDRVVVINIEQCGGSHTNLISPAGWTQERLLGYLARYRFVLEQ
jgi:hypothetical protein